MSNELGDQNPERNGQVCVGDLVAFYFSLTRTLMFIRSTANGEEKQMEDTEGFELK